MQKFKCRKVIVALVVMSCLTVTSCKGKEDKSDASAIDTTVNMSPPMQDAPVVISGDDSLSKGISDATKDFPGVNATVSNGEITLTGEIQRSSLPSLMQSLNSLNPKKINNNLTIK